MKKTVYVAGPLFSLAERDFNRKLAGRLSELLPDVNFLLPQVYSESVSAHPDFLERVFDYCVRSVEEADAVLAILEGSDADSGTCIELGYAYARGKPIVGLRTDFRGSEEKGLNLMVARVCRELVELPSTEAKMEKLAVAAARAVDRALGTH